MLVVPDVAVLPPEEAELPVDGVGQIDLASKTLYDKLFNGSSSLAGGVSALNKGAGQLYYSFYGDGTRNYFS